MVDKGDDGMFLAALAGLTVIAALSMLGRSRRRAWSARQPSRGAPASVPGVEPRVRRMRDSSVTRAVAYDGTTLTPTVSVVVPALNEEESVDWVIENIPAWVSEVVLVDGLSVDGTELVVTDRRPGVVIVHQRSRGKGAALRAGFAAATGDIVVMIDADGSTDPREMGRFVDALIEGADFVKGSRNLPGGGSVDFTRMRHWGNLGFVWAANAVFNVRFSDLCYGYCAFWRRDLSRLALTADGFEIEMELVLSAVKAGLRVAEVPSMELARRAGVSNLNAWTDGKRVLKTLLRQRLRRLDHARAAELRYALAMVELAAHGTEQWVPAGADRRAHIKGDRRVRTHTPAGYNGPERRISAERRAQPVETAEVLIAYGNGEGAVASAAVGRTPRARER